MLGRGRAAAAVALPASTRARRRRRSAPADRPPGRCRPAAAGPDRLAVPADPNDGVGVGQLPALVRREPGARSRPARRCRSAPRTTPPGWPPSTPPATPTAPTARTPPTPGRPVRTTPTTCCTAGRPSLGAAVQGWVDTPYHGAGFVDPTTTAIGFGFAGDTSTGLFSEGGAPQLSRWPKPDGVLPSPAMTTGESPDPRRPAATPAARWAGRSSCTLPAPAVFAASSIVGPAGPVAHCALHANPFEAGAPLLEAGRQHRAGAPCWPQSPYTQGARRTRPPWPCRAAPPRGRSPSATPPAPPAVTAAPSGAGQLTVAGWPADGHGLPITSYRVDDVTTGQSQVVAGSQTSAIVRRPRRRRHPRASRWWPPTTSVTARPARRRHRPRRPAGAGHRHRRPGQRQRLRQLDASPRRPRRRPPASRSSSTAARPSTSATSPTAPWPPWCGSHVRGAGAGHQRRRWPVRGPSPRSVTPRAARARSSTACPCRCGRSTPAPGAARRRRRRSWPSRSWPPPASPLGRGRRLDEPHRHERHRVRATSRRGRATSPSRTASSLNYAGGRARRAQPRHRAGRPRRHRLHRHRRARRRRHRRRRRVVLLRRRPAPRRSPRRALDTRAAGGPDDRRGRAGASRPAPGPPS